MKKAITVIGFEADGIRGLRLEENKAEWVVADSGFWPVSGPDGSSAGDDSGAAAGNPPPQAAEDGASPEGWSREDRYAATVEALKEASRRFGTREVVLSMPLASLLVKVSRTPVEERDRLAETAGDELGKVSPFPDETPVTGMETVAETDSDLVTVFAALPDYGSAETGDALDEAKVRVLRTDITALGWLRTLWPRIMSRPTDDRPADVVRRVVLMNLDDGWDVVVLDNGAPMLLRGLGGVSDPSEIGREVMLSILRAGGVEDAGEVVVFSKSEVDQALVERLREFAPVRTELVCGDENAAYGGVEGVALRTQEDASLDITPADWAELRTEARFTKRLMLVVAAAATGWALLMGALFGVPFVYGRMTERQKTLSKRHAKAYLEVKEMRDKVKLVQQYSDHARGTLEMLKAVSDRMPEGVTLTSFTYRRGERLSIAGEASLPTHVYEFKNALANADMEDGGRLFEAVTLTGPSQSKGVHKFSIECSFEPEEEEK